MKPLMIFVLVFLFISIFSLEKKIDMQKQSINYLYEIVKDLIKQRGH